MDGDFAWKRVGVRPVLIVVPLLREFLHVFLKQCNCSTTSCEFFHAHFVSGERNRRQVEYTSRAPRGFGIPAGRKCWA